MDEVKEIVDGLVRTDGRIAPLPAYFFRLTEYGSSALKFALRVWTEPGNFWSVKFDLLEGLLRAFRERGVSIPFDQLDVHFPDAAGRRKGVGR